MLSVFRYSLVSTVTVTSLFIACNSARTFPTESEPATISAEQAFERVVSICDLIQNAKAYSGRQVQVRTTFVRLGGQQYFADEECESRHPLFDAKFDPSFHSVVCRDDIHFNRQLCDIVTPEGNDIDLEVTAVFKGHFEEYPSTEGFSRDGFRFRMNVKDISTISEIENITSVRPK